MGKDTSGDIEYLFGMCLQPVDNGRGAQNHCAVGFQREKQCLNIQGERASQDFFIEDLKKPAWKQVLRLKADPSANSLPLSP